MLFYPFFWGVPLLKPNSRKKGTLIIKGLLGNLVVEHISPPNPEVEIYNELMSRLRVALGKLRVI